MDQKELRMRMRMRMRMWMRMRMRMRMRIYEFNGDAKFDLVEKQNLSGLFSTEFRARDVISMFFFFFSSQNGGFNGFIFPEPWFADNPPATPKFPVFFLESNPTTTSTDRQTRVPVEVAPRPWSPRVPRPFHLSPNDACIVVPRKAWRSSIQYNGQPRCPFESENRSVVVPATPCAGAVRTCYIELVVVSRN